MSLRQLKKSVAGGFCYTYEIDSLTAQTAKAKADYAGIVKDLETLAGITEIASKVHKTRTKAVEHEKKQEKPQQKKKNEQSL